VTVDGWTWRRLAAGLVLVTLLGGCSAPVRPELPSAAPPSATVPVPTGGVSLAELGFRNGPVDAFTLPESVVIGTRVDQPNGVTVVLKSPSATAIAGYLRRQLPATGFTVTSPPCRQTARPPPR